MTDDQRIADNQLLWDALVDEHVHSEFYNVRGFLQGADPLSALEGDTLGEIAGESLLHLMCHFGLDTLALARRGARVTGLDFSAEAVRVGAALAEREGLDATFVCADVVDAAAALDGQTFDIVFSSWGVTVWLADLTAWASSVAKCVRPGGRFHLLEVHPIAWTLLDPEDAGRVCKGPVQDYETDGVTLSQDIEGSYAGDVESSGRQHLWHHGVGRVVSALVAAGLQVERLVERPVVTTQVLPSLVERPDGLWTWPEGAAVLPLSYEVVVRKPAEDPGVTKTIGMADETPQRLT
ncbi:MAG: SAM-dependent methyltransferase [Myxococcota bacterium]|jgi:SAM-dependent methyltransferase